MFDRRGHNRTPFRPRIPGMELRSSDVPVAIIYRPSRDLTQSGPRPRHWILEFEPAQAAEIEPFMGWTATRDPYRLIRLSFPDRESAVEYAERMDWDYILRDDGRNSERRTPEPIFRPLERIDGPVPRVKTGSRRPAPTTDETDPVVLAALESFPASDPPAWTGTTIGRR